MVTIVIPHYQTLELIKLCLRSIRKYTQQPYQVIVVDNNSQDNSLEYLRSVKWINLIERKEGLMKQGSWAHGSALDLGLETTKTEFFLALHSDVIIKDSAWLSKLTDPFGGNPDLACVGTGKIEDVAPVYRVFKKMGDIKGLLRFLRRILSPADNQPLPDYIRTTCALYRTGVLKKENLSFLPVGEKGMTSGQALYYELIKRGYSTLSLPSQELKQVIEHLIHGTMVLNPALGAGKRTIKKGKGLMRKKMDEVWIQSLLTDATLDQ